MSLQQTEPISREVAAEVLYHFDPAPVSATQPGTFTQNLIRTFTAADDENFARLSREYPEYGHAVTLAKHDPQGLIVLESIAGQDNGPCPAALLPLGSDPVEPCIVRGHHTQHRTAEDRTWADDLDGGVR